MRSFKVPQQPSFEVGGIVDIGEEKEKTEQHQLCQQKQQDEEECFIDILGINVQFFCFEQGAGQVLVRRLHSIIDTVSRSWINSVV